MLSDLTVFALFFCAFASFFVTHGILNAAPVSHIVIASTIAAAGCAGCAYTLFAIAVL